MLPITFRTNSPLALSQLRVRRPPLPNIAWLWYWHLAKLCAPLDLKPSPLPPRPSFTFIPLYHCRPIPYQQHIGLRRAGNTSLEAEGLATVFDSRLFHATECSIRPRPHLATKNHQSRNPFTTIYKQNHIHQTSSDRAISQSIATTSAHL